ncbi:helix-turn-helix domain-containing protein [Rhodobacter capsulatus]|uniref:Helix-turn-helix domain-containing protein n=1 Tax=Rhodobacter capsulatus TaxID=1061 RepID=A0A4U1JSN3_RHOCA|nr:AraC family transcriptional regulator [Rhodobacter capsulatus]TKD21406.1 helix-turn-helix domain-containing protein [Rhodobacter capsulatus]
MHSRGAADRRTIQTRPLVGTTARILQKCDLRFSRIRVEQPTLIQIRAGVKEITDGNYSCRLVAGDVVAIAGGQSLDITNHLDSHGTYEARWLVWDGSILAAFRAEQSAEPLATARKFPASPPLIEALDRAFDAVDGASRLPDSIARHRLVEMLVWLAEQGVCFDPVKKQTTERRVRDLLARRLGHDWTMTEVAESLAMSESSLRRHLAETGTGFAELLADMRMSMAMRLLQSTDLPIGHIAAEVGYASASRFAIRFRARFGFAPSAIRGHQR